MPEFLYSGFKFKISWAPKFLQIYLCFSSSLLMLWCWYGELILSFFMWKLRIMLVSQIVHCDQMWDSRCWMGLEHICGFSWLALTRRMQRYTAIRLKIAMIKPMHSKSFWQRSTTISNPLWIIVPYVSPYDDRSPQSWAYDLHFKFCDPSTCDATHPPVLLLLNLNILPGLNPDFFGGVAIYFAMRTVGVEAVAGIRHTTSESSQIESAGSNSKHIDKNG